MQKKPYRVVLAAGGTGGHLFPAQKLADELNQRCPGIQLLFVGSGLKTNRFFEKERFAFEEILSATPFGRSLRAIASAFISLFKGTSQSSKILADFKPDLVIGFGSYHSFPVLCAALLKKVPIILFESNAEPGKVNRFFSRWAKVTAVQFPEAARSLQGNSVEVSMPLKKQENRATLSEARDYFSLQADKLTFLVFGGSQGADTINRGVYEAFVALKKTGSDFQVIHLTGSAKNSEALRSMYQNGSISAQVKEFEHHMDLAWIAADLAICRCGAGTIAEQIDFEVPGILIPYPYAYEHQSKNGLFMTQKVGGAVMLKDDELKGSTLQKMIEGLIDPQKNALAAMRHSIAEFKRHRNVQTLSDLVIKEMEI